MHDTERSYYANQRSPQVLNRGANLKYFNSVLLEGSTSKARCSSVHYQLHLHMPLSREENAVMISLQNGKLSCSLEQCLVLHARSPPP